MKAASALTFVLIQTAMYWNVQAVEQFSGQNVIRYDYLTDYTAAEMGSMEDADNFCQNKGFKLITLDQLCPDGPGKPPVGGTVNENHWVAVNDDVERYVHIGKMSSFCMGDQQIYGGPIWWGKAGNNKESWFNNQVYCYTGTAATAAPTPKATVSMEDAVGDGCKNSVQFSSSSRPAMGEACNACPLCEDSSLSSIFNSSSQGICFDCNGIDIPCDGFEIVTSFEKEWAMKFISLVPSHAGSDYDPWYFTMEGSNEDDVWHKLLENTVQFMGQNEPMDYPVDNHLVKKYKQYKVTFIMKQSLKMSIDHYAIISSYTKTCTSNIHEDITGKYVKPYKTI